MTPLDVPRTPGAARHHSPTANLRKRPGIFAAAARALGLSYHQFRYYLRSLRPA